MFRVFKQFGDSNWRLRWSPRKRKKINVYTSRILQLMRKGVSRNSKVWWEKSRVRPALTVNLYAKLPKRIYTSNLISTKEANFLRNKRVRLQKCLQLIYRRYRMENIVFSHEKLFTIKQAHNCLSKQENLDQNDPRSFAIVTHHICEMATIIYHTRRILILWKAVQYLVDFGAKPYRSSCCSVCGIVFW